MLFSLTVYLVVSIAIGIGQVVDAVMLLKHRGVVKTGAAIFSIIEYLWAGVSLVVWSASRSSFLSWLPLSFVVYVLLLFVLGLTFAMQNRGKATALPTSIVLAGGVFGVYFAAVAAFYMMRQ